MYATEMHTTFQLKKLVGNFHRWEGSTKLDIQFNKGANVSHIKVFNYLPQYIKALTNDHTYLKSTFKRFLYRHSFYSMNEYYEYKEDRRL